MQFSSFLTQSIVHYLDALADRFLPADNTPPHQKIGRRGEEDAYFYLRRLGYVMVARDYRSPHRRGDIDLIGWDKDVLCFIEVKSRTTHDVKPAEAAVDEDKQRVLRGMAGDYLRQLREIPQWRFDVISVYYDSRPARPKFELFKNACPVS
ncbi:MAG TPA: YraN family protein [Terriglobales bacterium]|nr:YraN family protein [Terriglobales bacterium]